MVFGLPNSGKSTLVKAICKKSTKYWTLEEDEVQCEENGLTIKKDRPGAKWVVSHQLPTMDERITDTALSKFLAEKMGLNPKKWAIVRIKTK
jgi:adenylate kinase family enzyme